ncbi:TGRM2 protein, partial [Orthonyx spaldingii]|nr:TGRM2 protein [Orthonyx spaldingii]
MDSEVDEVAQVLLQMVCSPSKLIQKAAREAVGIMVENVTPAQAMTALMESGLQSHHVQVWKCAAEHLLALMQKFGGKKLAGSAARVGRLIQMAVKLIQDKDTRHYGCEMVQMLMTYQKPKRLLEQSVSTCDM